MGENKATYKNLREFQILQRQKEFSQNKKKNFHLQQRRRPLRI